MTTIEELRELFIDKLRRSGSFDEAIMKIAWVAFSRGVEVGRQGDAVSDTMPDMQNILSP
jgi:hypothetical protein